MLGLKLATDPHWANIAEKNLEENFGDWRVPDPSYISHLESPSTSNKGALPFMLTARLTAIGAMVQKKDIKLRKILKLMREYQSHPSAMPMELIESLEHQLEQRSQKRELSYVE